MKLIVQQDGSRVTTSSPGGKTYMPGIWHTTDDKNGRFMLRRRLRTDGSVSLTVDVQWSDGSTERCTIPVVGGNRVGELALKLKKGDPIWPFEGVVRRLTDADIVRAEDIAPLQANQSLQLSLNRAVEVTTDPGLTLRGKPMPPTDKLHYQIDEVHWCVVHRSGLISAIYLWPSIVESDAWRSLKNQLDRIVSG